MPCDTSSAVCLPCKVAPHAWSRQKLNWCCFQTFSLSWVPGRDNPGRHRTQIVFNGGRFCPTTPQTIKIQSELLMYLKFLPLPAQWICCKRSHYQGDTLHHWAGQFQLYVHPERCELWHQWWIPKGVRHLDASQSCPNEDEHRNKYNKCKKDWQFCTSASECMRLHFHTLHTTACMTASKPPSGASLFRDTFCFTTSSVKRATFSVSDSTCLNPNWAWHVSWILYALNMNGG